jgi:saccharopine dehydrogenase (NAD+, L-lysine forming)
MAMKVGILRETKNPPDRRVPITPAVGQQIKNNFKNVQLFAQSSELRAINDTEYVEAGIPIVDDVNDCNVLIGVKEVKINELLPDKTYLFFSHTGKKQSYNRTLLQEMARLGITMIDYEYLTDKENMRLVAFGRWAGIVGAYNAVLAYGLRTKIFNVKRAFECFDLAEMLSHLDNIKLPPVKILITGGGRVANGAMETLAHLKIKSVSPEEFLKNTFTEPVICRIDPQHYVKHKDNKEFDLKHFFNKPNEYDSTFLPYAFVTDIFIPCHFWDPNSPVFLKPEDYILPGFKIKVIADVSCDLYYPIPSTIRSSKIADPIYGYNPFTKQEDEPYVSHNVTVMAIDNLPGELPRNSSEEFSQTLYEKVFPSLFGEDVDGIIERATILKNGKLTPHFAYLQDYLEGK